MAAQTEQALLGVIMGQILQCLILLLLVAVVVRGKVPLVQVAALVGEEMVHSQQQLALVLLGKVLLVVEAAGEVPVVVVAAARVPSDKMAEL